MKKEDEESEFHYLDSLDSEETLACMLRICFLCADLSPEILHKATGVDRDVCINFLSHLMAVQMFDSPPEILKKREEK